MVAPGDRVSLRIRSVWYGVDGSPYHRMARVLEHTARRYHKHVMVERRGGAFTGDRSAAFKCKARDWTEIITRSAPGDVLCLLDADTFFQRSAELIQASDFDIAVTTHQGALNSGVLFARPSDAVISFFASWAWRTDKWCAKNRADSIRYGDQDALEDMLREDRTLRVLRLQMREWNSTQKTWGLGIEDARIVHFKSDARAHVFGGRDCSNAAMVVANKWRSLEKEIDQ